MPVGLRKCCSACNFDPQYHATSIAYRADRRATHAPSNNLIKIARLGGYLDRAKDPPPGNIVMWRGLSRLTDIALGATLKIDDVGN